MTLLIEIKKKYKKLILFAEDNTLDILGASKADVEFIMSVPADKVGNVEEGQLP